MAVLVDDAHWLDGSSADALLFAFRRLVADPVAVVLAMRQGEPSLLDGADLPALRLHGLDRGSAAELLRHQGDEPLSQELADRLHRETGGNPLALLELGQERERLADLPPGRAARRRDQRRPRLPDAPAGCFRSAPATSSPSPPPSMAARCRCWPAPRRCSGWTCPTWFPPRQRA